MRFLPALALLLLTAPAMAQVAPQPPVPQEDIIVALNLKATNLQRDLDAAYLQLAQISRTMTTNDRNAAWVLDNWIPKVKE